MPTPSSRIPQTSCRFLGGSGAHSFPILCRMHGSPLVGTFGRWFWEYLGIIPQWRRSLGKSSEIESDSLHADPRPLRVHQTHLYPCSNDLIWICECDSNKLRASTSQDILHVGLSAYQRSRAQPQSLPVRPSCSVPIRTNFSSALVHVRPSRSSVRLFKAARLVLISSYVANCIDPFDTPTSANNDPRYSPRIPSAM